jgi:phospholipid-binding lipoprotein MlaA
MIELRRPLCTALALLLTGCAASGSAVRDPRDPFERVNRATFALNENLDRAFGKPITRAYRAVAPQAVRTGISNFMRNAGYPTVIINDVLQGKMDAGIRDTGRMLINSTLGLAGLLDPASAAGLELNDEDFGQTLGKWGVRPGAYLMLPILGPSSVRDGFGRVADELTDPRQHVDDTSIKWSLQALRQVDRRSRLMDAELILDRAADKYVIARSAYLQRREYLVRDGMVEEEPPPEDPAAEAPQ